jgi:hypothetical protein
MEAATSGGRALARGIESASKSISDAIKQKDEEEKQINKLAKAGDTALSALNKLFPNENVYGEAGEEGYKNMGAEDRLAHYSGQNAALEMGNKLLAGRASRAATAASDMSVQRGQHEMDQDDATAQGVQQTLDEFAKPPVSMPPLPQGFGDAATPAQQQGSVAPTQKSFMQRRADAMARALMLNPNADVSGMATAVDRLLPEPEEKGTAIPGSLNNTSHPDYFFGIQSDSGAGSFIKKPGADGAGGLEIKTAKGADGQEVDVVMHDGKPVPSATTALHRGSAEKNPFDELNSQGQQVVSQWVRSYWSALKEKSDLEADMATNNLKQGDDVPATEGWFGAGGDSYEEVHEKLDDKIADMMQKMNSFNIHPNDFNRTTGQPTRNLGTDMSFDAFQRENQ